MAEKKNSKFSQLIDGLKNLVKDFNNEATETKAAVKPLADDGGDVYFDGDLAEGTAVFQDEAMATPCEDGPYQFSDGTEITVAAGLVTVFTPGDDSSAEETQDAATVKELQDKVAALEAEKIELQNSIKEGENVMASAAEAMKKMKSSYRPDKRENNFKTINKQPEDKDSIADKMKERKAEYRTTKKIQR